MTTLIAFAAMLGLPLALSGSHQVRPGRPPQFAPPDPVAGTVFPGDGSVSVGAEHAHDPTVLDFDGRYVCFSTSGNGFGVVRVSNDLLTWRDLGPIMPETPEWLRKRIPAHRSLWAPDAVKIGRDLRLYYCASERFGGNGSVIGMAECKGFDAAHPQKGWEDRGLVFESVQGKDSINAIDPEVTIDADGRHWLFFGSYYAGIHVIELDPATGKLKHPDKRDLVCVARNTAERGNPVEAAAVCRRDGMYYLFVSYGLAAQGVRSTYRIMVGRSKSPNGPFVDEEGKPMVDGGHVSVLKGSPPMFSPGHSDVLRDHTGRWLLPYHFYDGRSYWHNDMWGLPRLQVRELLWGDDGWPLPGLPVEYGRKDGPGKPKLGSWTHQVDFGQPSVVVLRDDGTVLEGIRRGRWKLDGDRLTMEWPRDDAPDRPWIDALKVAYGGTYYVGRNQAGVVIRGIFRKPRT